MSEYSFRNRIALFAIEFPSEGDIYRPSRHVFHLLTPTCGSVFLLSIVPENHLGRRARASPRGTRYYYVHHGDCFVKSDPSMGNNRLSSEYSSIWTAALLPSQISLSIHQQNIRELDFDIVETTVARREGQNQDRKLKNRVR